MVDDHPQFQKMLPPFYQRVLEKHLNEKQYLTIELLILMIQSFRQVKLSTLTSVFPQPIKYDSRKRYLQRFLQLGKLNVKLLWFPIIKYWLRQEYHKSKSNREQRRRAKKSFKGKSGHILLIIDRTQWKDKNLMVISWLRGQQAIPVYWELISHQGSSDLSFQKSVLQPVLKLFKPYPIVVIGDREFHSAKLGMWLIQRGVDFILRQKKSSYIQQAGCEFKAVKEMGFKPGDTQFMQGISCNKDLGLCPFNLVIRWKRKSREKSPSYCWYLLTSLSDSQQVLAAYRARWAIETMFKSCKTGGYNLEQTCVNSTRLLALFLLITLAYTLSILEANSLYNSGHFPYISSTHYGEQPYLYHSDFTLGLLALAWINSMALWSELASALMELKPHKRLHFQQGLNAYSLIQQASWLGCHP